MLNVLLGITGGVSAYKATAIIRALTEAGHRVKVIPTANALRFIGATTLEALSHNSVDSDLFTDVDSVKHVALGQEADLIIVAPATAAFLARFAAGMADDLLLNTILASKAPIIVAPAMHTEMWQNPATVFNVGVLRGRGVHVMEPDSGRLTGADSGPGRLPTAEAIVETALGVAALNSNALNLAGKHVVVTAGGTREPIDPVRFIGNHSSGRQGIALAITAKAAGARVTLIGANLQQEISGIDNFISVETAQQMESELGQLLPTADVLLMAAAVSDFRVENPPAEKLKRSKVGNEYELRLVANQDILAGAMARVTAENLGTIVVGFAAETAGSHERLAALAAIKLEAKGCHLLVANDVTAGAVFGAAENNVYILDSNGHSSHGVGSKFEVARAVLGRVYELIRS